ncbi:hypothetical protein EY643_02095 [Halioglobus maricola]|uniref:Uncharacterized protein n=1 Tax=Halioglobus maricola TaxID=2601894 RepID=A0A5P9NRP9_9GAMM|nr:hypothetical protein EY643_02095 [Halioglobus maricola]
MRLATVLLAGLSTAACVTSTVDEMVFNEPVEGIGDSTVVILGRRHAADYETEPDFIQCVGDHISSRDRSITVIGELEFVNSLYPWFEPRTAPLHPQNIDRLLLQEPVAERMAELKTEYMIWIDGKTERSDSMGSMTCGIGPGGAGCFGFGTWSDDSDYEAVIWDFTDRAEVGRVNTTASGQSYMPAVVVPIPIIAPVQGTACDGIGDQLLEFLSSEY